MIRLQRGPVPPVLEANAEQWTNEYVALLRGDPGVPAAAATRYRHPDIKQAVVRDSSGKCVYCESKPRAVAPGDVDHQAPKSVKPERIVDWSNLVFSCPACNTAKGPYFDEALPLLDPYEEDPADHLRFDGPMVTDKTQRGEITMIKLRLNRPELLQRRAERLDGLRQLVRRWMQMEPGPLKEELRTLLQEEAEARNEYTAAAREFLGREGVIPAAA